MQTAVQKLEQQLKDVLGDMFIDFALEQEFEQAKEMEYKQNMYAMQRGMELQNKESNRIGFRERNGLISSKTEISDEEIEKQAIQIYSALEEEEFVAWKNGAKWAINKLKNK